MKKYTFIPWLRRQIKREDPVGDLSRDTFMSSFKGRTLLSLEEKMFSHNPCDEAWQALDIAKKEYKKYRLRKI